MHSKRANATPLSSSGAECCKDRTADRVQLSAFRRGPLPFEVGHRIKRKYARCHAPSSRRRQIDQRAFIALGGLWLTILALGSSSGTRAITADRS